MAGIVMTAMNVLETDGNADQRIADTLVTAC